MVERDRKVGYGQGRDREVSLGEKRLGACYKGHVEEDHKFDS